MISLSAVRSHVACILALALVLYPAVRASAQTPTLSSAPSGSSSPSAPQPPTSPNVQPPPSTSAAASPSGPTDATLPPELLNAHKVFIANGGGDNYFELFTGGPNRAYRDLYADLKRSGRYEIVASPRDADVVLEIRAIAPYAGYGDDTGGPNPQLILRVLDPATNTLLWTTTANVRAAGTLKQRNHGFDQSMDVIVDKLDVTTGQSLSTAQMKAIKANSQWSTGEKVLVFGGIAAGIALLAVGLYEVSNRPQLPTVPQTPQQPFPVFP